jgi:hypothetical protein
MTRLHSQVSDQNLRHAIERIHFNPISRAMIYRVRLAFLAGLSYLAETFEVTHHSRNPQIVKCLFSFATPLDCLNDGERAFRSFTGELLREGQEVSSKRQEKTAQNNSERSAAR